jgi:hypothetical protein
MGFFRRAAAATLTAGASEVVIHAAGRQHVQARGARKAGKYSKKQYQLMLEQVRREGEGR